MKATAHGDRYGGVTATKIDNFAECTVRIDDIPKACEEMRTNFNLDKPTSLKWRKQQLKQLLKLCNEGRKEIHEALYKDLHKSATEADITEIDLVMSEIYHALEHVEHWMKPVSTKSTALNLPCSSELYYDPLGVVLIMSAWNYPFQLLMAPLVGAIAAGNCVMLRPASYAVNTSHCLAKLIGKYLDNECIRVTEGNRDVTTKLLEQKWDTIFFTGSTFVGKKIAEAAAKQLCPVVLELGGKSPCIVDKSANIEHAANRLIWGTFLNSAQTCVRSDHLLVHKDIADEFLATCKNKILDFFGKDKDVEKSNFFGRVINDKAFERLKEFTSKIRKVYLLWW